jgi:type I restriction enzyme S subunit
MSSWNSLPLGSLVSFKKGKKVETSSFPKPGYQRYLGAGSLVRKHDGFGASYMSVQANTEDILMLWDGERSGLVRNKLDGIVSSTVSKLTPNGNVISDYLYYFLQLNYSWIQNRRTGTGIPHVPKDLNRILHVNYPVKKAHQVKICSILKALDQSIESTEQLIQKYQQIKIGLMQDLFTRGIAADGKLRPLREQAPDLYHKTKIGWIPKDWTPKPLSKVCTYQHGRPFPSEEYADEGILLLRPGNLHISGFVIFDEAHRTHIPKYWESIAPSYLVNNNDILMNLTAQSLDDGFLGRVCFYESNEKSLLNQRIARFKPLSVEHSYLYWLLRSQQFREQIEKTSQGTKVQHLYNRDIDRVTFAIPNAKEEQNKISLALDTVTKKIRSTEECLIKLKQQKPGLMHDLLTGKKPVMVDEQEIKYV